MDNNIFDKPELLMEYYKTQKDECLFRSKLIWEETKFKYCLILILIVLPIIFLANKGYLQFKETAPYIILIPFMAFFFSIVAFTIVRREYPFYYATHAHLLYIEKYLGLTSRSEFLDARLKKALKENFTVEDFIDGTRPLGSFIPGKAKISTMELMGFILFAIISLLEILFCLALTIF